VNRRFRDRDYLETVDRLFFTVIGNVHPEDKVLAYLKYLPDPSGRWGRGEKRYRRSMRYYSVPNVMDAVDFLSGNFPQYVFYSEPLNFKFSAVSNDRIAKHYCPEQRLRELLNGGQRDALESKAIELAHVISDESGVSLDHLGITGSILLNVHGVSFSDIDLVVYGREEARRIKEALLSLYHQKGSGVERLRGKSLSTWCKEMSVVHPFSSLEAKKLYNARKWNKGTFRDTIFSIHPTKVEDEVSERYADEFYRPYGIVEAKAKVVDSADSYFLPAVYLVKDVRFGGDVQFGMVEKVVSYEGLYSDVASNGEEILVRGKLEEVHNASGQLKSRRILIGSPEAHASDFIKAVTPTSGNP
jgi:predicted nucleotidyltransferase